MSDHHDPHEPVPRIPLAGAILLVGIALAAVTFSRVTGVGSVVPVSVADIEVRELRFEDRPDGSIAVRDGRDGSTVWTAAPGTNGFMRGVLRGFARERKRSDFGQEVPFRLVRKADDRMLLEDPTTGRRVDLGSFGRDNAIVFAALLGHGQARATHIAASASPDRPASLTTESPHGRQP